MIALLHTPVRSKDDIPKAPVDSTEFLGIPGNSLWTPRGHLGAPFGDTWGPSRAPPCAVREPTSGQPGRLPPRHSNVPRAVGRDPGPPVFAKCTVPLFFFKKGNCLYFPLNEEPEHRLFCKHREGFTIKAYPFEKAVLGVSILFLKAVVRDSPN